MSLIDAKSLIMIPGNTCVATTVLTAGTMDAAGERLGNICIAGKAGNVRNVYFRTGTVTTADVLKISLQGVNSSGVPDGTILATATGRKAYTTATFQDTDDSKWLGPFQLTEDCPLTLGQQYSIVFEWNSYTDGNVQIALCGSASGVYNAYSCDDVSATPGTWAKGGAASRSYAVALEFDDGTFMPFIGGTGYPTTVYLNINSIPDEIGNYFKCPFPFRAVGFWVYGDFDYDVTLSLLDASDNLKANCLLNSNYRWGTAFGTFYLFFDGDPASYVDIAKDTWYRVIITPSSTSNVGVSVIDTAVGAAMSAYDLGTDCHWIQRTDEGAWSETTTRRCPIGLIGNRLDDGTGSGGGGGPIFGGHVVR